jgi:DNA invertase Pin-like site-specific DNA recombinase
MLAAMLSNCARIVLVENASRFARDLVVQITGHDLLRDKGIQLIPVDAPSHFQDETPTATMVRSILGAVSQFEKEALVLKLRKARERKRKDTGRCEGNPQWNTVPAEHAEAARAARAAGQSLRAIATTLESKGLKGRNGKAYAAGSIASMLETTAERTAKRKARTKKTATAAA